MEKKGYTPYHEDALLFESLEDAQSIVDRINQDQFQRDLVNHDDLTEWPLPWAVVEEVEDEEEFRSREPTW